MVRLRCVKTVVTSPVRYKTYQLVNPLSCHVAKQVFSNTYLLVATATFSVFVLAAAFTFAMFVLAATFAFAVFVVMATASAFTTAFAVAAAVAAFVVDERLNFLVSGIAHGYNLALEVEILAGERVVEVDDDGVVFELEHKALKAHAVGINQGQYGAGVNHVLVEAAVDGKCLLGQFDDVVLLVRAISLDNFQHKVESFAFGQGQYFAFKRVECNAKARDKLEGVFDGSLLNQFVNAFVVVGVQFVCYCYILVRCLLFHK